MEPTTTADTDRDDRGASLVEYALLVALVAVASIAALTSLGGTASGSLKDGADAITNASSTTVAVSGCATIHADGYGTGAGYGADCYSPTFGAYDLPD